MNSMQPYESPLSRRFSSKILEWVAMLFSRESSQHRYRQASLKFPALPGRSFTTSASWKAQEDVVHTYNGILLNDKRDGSFVEMVMDLESIIHSKVSQKDKNKYHVLTYMWNLEK